MGCALGPTKEIAGDPHLRSTRLLAGLHTHCPDGHLGHVEDFLIDDELWSVGYLVADTPQLVAGQARADRSKLGPFDLLARPGNPLAHSRDQIEHRPAYEGVAPSEEPVVGTA